ncbi:MAG: DUF4340 domain-containing protein [Alphaproteobacteria bacterium]|nr:DUF4340 domain-containing protein [Alphaproteobacteria bacterium]
MQTRTLATLAVSAAVIAGAAFYVSASHDRTPANDHAGELIYPALARKADEVAHIAIARDGDRFELLRGADGTWVLPAHGGYRVDFPQVRRLLLEAASLRIEEARTANPALHAEIEVDGSAKGQKATELVLSDAKGDRLADLLVGRTRFGRSGTAGDGTFVRRAGENQVWFAQGRLSIEREAPKWLERRISDVARERMKHATVVLADGKRIDVSRDKPDQEDFTLVPIPEGKKVKSPFDVNLVASAVELLDLEDVRKADGLAFAGDRDFCEYTTFEGLDVRVEFAHDGADLWARFAVKYEAPATPVEGKKLKKPEDVAKEADAIAARTKGWAYKIPAYKLEYMQRKVDDLVIDAKAS